MNNTDTYADLKMRLVRAILESNSDEMNALKEYIHVSPDLLYAAIMSKNILNVLWLDNESNLDSLTSTELIQANELAESIGAHHISNWIQNQFPQSIVQIPKVVNACPYWRPSMFDDSLAVIAAHTDEAEHTTSDAVKPTKGIMIEALSRLPYTTCLCM